jgi:hypothetical protein
MNCLWCFYWINSDDLDLWHSLRLGLTGG